MSSKKERAWPWGIAGIYGAFVLALVAYLVFSSFQRVDLVSEDYYHDELEYQDQIERIRRTAAIPGAVKIELSADQKWLQISFNEYFDASRVKGSISLFRPSDARADKRLPLQLSVQRTQSISVAALAKGKWTVKILWNHAGREYYFEEDIFI